MKISALSYQLNTLSSLQSIIMGHHMTLTCLISWSVFFFTLTQQTTRAAAFVRLVRNISNWSGPERINAALGGHTWLRQGLWRVCPINAPSCWPSKRPLQWRGYHGHPPYLDGRAEQGDATLKARSSVVARPCCTLL